MGNIFLKGKSSPTPSLWNRISSALSPVALTDKIGIGCNDPTKNLEIRTSVKGEGAIIGNVFTGVWQINADFMTLTHLDVSTSSTSYIMIQKKDGQSNFNTATNTDMSFKVGNVTKATMGRDGNFGCGHAFPFLPKSMLSVKGPIATAIATKTANYTLTNNDSTVLGDAASGNITMTLSSVSGIAGRQYTVKKIDSSANTVTVAGTIDGATNKVLNTQYDSVTVQTDGSVWWII